MQLAQLISEGTDWLLDPGHKEDMEDFLKQCQLMNQALSLCKSLVSKEDQARSSVSFGASCTDTPHYGETVMAALV